MKIKEARDKYFDQCIEIENKLLEIKFESIYGFNFSFYKNDKFSEINKKIINHIKRVHKNEWVGEIKKPNNSELTKRIELYKNDFLTNKLNDFLRSYIKKELRKLFNLLKSELKWTNRHSIKEIIRNVNHNGKKQKLLDIAKDHYGRSFKINFIDEKGKKIVSEVGNNLSSLSQSKMEKYSKLRNALAHKRGDEEISDDLKKFIDKEFKNFLDEINTLHKFRFK